MRRQQTAHTPDQLAEALGWSGRQLDDARRLGLIPAPDVVRPKQLGPRWSPTAVRDLRARRDALTMDLAMGALGSSRLAEQMAARLGVDVDPDAVAELSRMGLIPHAGTFKGHNLYAVWAALRVTDLAVLAQAAVSGHLHTTDRVLMVLNVRSSDLDHLVRQGWLRPARWADNPWLSKRAGAGTVPLYRHGDLVALLAYPGIDWDRVRATPPGRRSLLSRIGVCRDVGRAALDRLSRGLLYHHLGHRQFSIGDTAAAVASWQAAGDYPTTLDHLADVDAGDTTPIMRCAAWMALLPPGWPALV